jgi:predicted O-methyltransferase YrrM
MESDLKGQVYQLIAEDPKLHDWGLGLQSGGLSGEILTTLADYLIDEFGANKFRSLETGSGLSTLVFMQCSPAAHIAINPDPDVRIRIMDEADRRGINSSSTEYLQEFSEYVLPGLSDREIDIALIDGGHGWPAVFVDFCYANMMLRAGGVMVVDDITLFPCTQLYMLLKHQPGWLLEKCCYQKTAFFRKQTSAKLMPDFGGQPYLKLNLING